MKRNYADIIAGFLTGIILFALAPWIFSGSMRPGLAGYEIIIRIFPAADMLMAIITLAISYITIGVIPFFIYRRFLNPLSAARAGFFSSFLFFASGIALLYFLECAISGILFVFSSPMIL